MVPRFLSGGHSVEPGIAMILRNVVISRAGAR